MTGGRQLLTVRLLGRMEVQAGIRPVRVPGRQAQALLALLVLEPRRRTREAIATDLWPDNASSSTGCLRQALWLVRSAIVEAGVDPDRLLEIEGDALGIRQGVRIPLDVTEFEAAARSQPVRAAAAVEAYHGDLVEALGQECFVAERERLSDLFEDALQQLAEDRLAAGDADGARDAAERLLGRDPLREEAHAVLIAVYARTGTRSQVARQYRRLCSVLDRDLDVEPLPETVMAYREALAMTVARSRRAAALRPIPLLPGIGRRGPSLSRTAALRAAVAGG